MICSPVGTDEERESGVIWPGNWRDSNPYGTRYMLGNSWAVHTGADLNLPGNQDANAPVHSIADGEVTFAYNVPKYIGRPSTWGNLIVILHHEIKTFSRYGHLGSMNVKVGDMVSVGQQIGTIGNSGMSNIKGNEHLHFDICTTFALKNDAIKPLGPMFWPGDNLAMVKRHFRDPKTWLRRMISGTADAIPVRVKEALRVREEPRLSGAVVAILNRGRVLIVSPSKTAADGFRWREIREGQYAGLYVADEYLEAL